MAGQPTIKTRRRFIFPFAAYVGTVFGAGLYSIPYVMSQSGIWMFALFLIIVSLLVLLVNLLYAEVVVSTSKSERFLGYVEQFFGARMKHIFGWITITGFWGTFLAYLLILGQFAKTVFGSFIPLSEISFSLIFFILTFIAVRRGSKTLERMDVIMLGVVAVLFLVLFGLGADHVSNIIFGPQSVVGYFLPYGTIMFALWGAGVIPEVVNQLRGHRQQIKKLLIYGTMIPVVVELVFALFVVSISGNATSREAFLGLAPFLGKGIVVLGSFIGLVTVMLAYNNLAWVARNILMFDLKQPKLLAIAGSVLPSVVLLLLGVHNFTLLISINGAVFLALEGLMIFSLYNKSRTLEKDIAPSILRHNVNRTVVRTGIVIFVVGLIVEVSLLLYEFILQ